MYFVEENIGKEPTVKFPVIQEKIVVRLRSLYYSTIYQSLRKSFTPCVYYAFGYWLFGSYMVQRLENFLNLTSDMKIYSLWSILVMNPMLNIYVWILMAQIQSGMILMQEIFSIKLSEEMHFPISVDQMKTTDSKMIDPNAMYSNTSNMVTLVDALSNIDIPLIQKLAAWDLYTITFSDCLERRKIIYILSVPGKEFFIYFK